MLRGFDAKKRHYPSFYTVYITIGAWHQTIQLSSAVRATSYVLFSLWTTKVQ